jgi:glycosyltransferase involved in cell wall biosynthesis
MKLLFCIKAMNNSGGGAERVLADVANGLVARQHDVSVLTFEQPGGQSFYPLDARIHRIELGIGSTIAPATVGETVKRMLALRHQVTSLRPDVAIGFMHSMYIPLGLALVGTSIPVIASEHNVPANYQARRKLESQLLALVPLLVEHITCVSETVQEAYPSHLRVCMVPIPNPLTLKVTHPANPLGQFDEPKTLLSVGRLEAQKDHESLIRAFAKIHHDVPDWHLRIVGEGSLRAALETTVRTLVLSNRVQLPGSSAHIAAEYQSAQLFVMPSRYESFGLTAAEALAHGLAVIGFEDCPGINQIIQPGINGILVPRTPDRVSALALALKTLMLDNDLRQNLSQPNPGHLKKYSLQSVLNQWETLLLTYR